MENHNWKVGSGSGSGLKCYIRICNTGWQSGKNGAGTALISSDSRLGVWYHRWILSMNTIDGYYQWILLINTIEVLKFWSILLVGIKLPIDTFGWDWSANWYFSDTSIPRWYQESINRNSRSWGGIRKVSTFTLNPKMISGKYQSIQSLLLSSIELGMIPILGKSSKTEENSRFKNILRPFFKTIFASKYRMWDWLTPDRYQPEVVLAEFWSMLSIPRWNWPSIEWYYWSRGGIDRVLIDTINPEVVSAKYLSILSIARWDQPSIDQYLLPIPNA